MFNKILVRVLIMIGFLGSGCQENIPELTPPLEPVDHPSLVPVRAQQEAYNRHDIEAFLAAYSEDLEVYSFPDSLIGLGLDGMRAQTATLFEVAPNVRVEIPERMVFGKYVFDREILFGMPGLSTDEGQESAVIYEVNEGKIIRTWFFF